MRVISGSARGLKLLSPEGLDTRPTLDRVKEALFSMLFDKVADSAVLDLFAGSGALGIEALSRYAAGCTFTDSDKRAIATVNLNLEKARLKDRAKVLNTDSIQFLKTADEPFDLIFLDPPYKAGLYEEVFEIIKSRKLLSDGGLIAAECNADIEIAPSGFEIIKNKTYGKVRLCVLKERE